LYVLIDMMFTRPGWLYYFIWMTLLLSDWLTIQNSIPPKQNFIRKYSRYRTEFLLNYFQYVKNVERQEVFDNTILFTVDCIVYWIFCIIKSNRLIIIDVYLWQSTSFFGWFHCWNINVNIMLRLFVILPRVLGLRWITFHK
jgi:hypothetical protein